MWHSSKVDQFQVRSVAPNEPNIMKLLLMTKPHVQEKLEISEMYCSVKSNVVAKANSHAA